MYLSAYSQLICNTDPASGIGEVIMNHNFNMSQGEMVDAEILDVPVTYLAPSTDNEIQSILTASDKCHQVVHFGTRGCWGATEWVSINGDVWNPTMFSDQQR